MQTIETRDDIAMLPEPRFIYTASAKTRYCAIALLVMGACLSGATFVHGLSLDGLLITAASGAIALIACLSVLFYLRSGDWRAWIQLAATPEGLYLVALARRVVFASWRDVLEIKVLPLVTLKGTSSYVQLTLCLSEDNWSRFGKTWSVKGTGNVRRLSLSALNMTGEELARELQAIRDLDGDATEIQAAVPAS